MDETGTKMLRTALLLLYCHLKTALSKTEVYVNDFPNVVSIRAVNDSNGYCACESQRY